MQTSAKSRTYLTEEQFLLEEKTLIYQEGTPKTKCFQKRSELTTMKKEKYIDVVSPFM
jgi:hypothetical protein